MAHQFGKETTAEEVAAVLSKSIQGKTVLITGATWGGLGAEAARVIAKHGAALVIVAGRRKEALEETISNIKKEAAKEVNGYTEPIDVLINNAAIMASSYAKTEDGFEAHGGHRISPIRFTDPGFSNGDVYNKWQAYGQSKTANILFAKELSTRYKGQGVAAFSLHPGVIETNLANHLNMEEEIHGDTLGADGTPVFTAASAKLMTRKTIPQGTSTHIVAAFDPAIQEQSGSYLQDAHIDNEAARPYALDDENAKKLWELSENLVGESALVANMIDP
ncbi:NAD(P)-binding protein [Basidiobolus meristosporus CBS 931.73]|uniref:NAD(P)-binding protein n=1 Tax=Basidiobolus meristosporus CBS 931.73 TaxID=1314790 RepID=A0A1Y1XSD1_9FUNG|nr:NAD(P)-binding protein [Basidiobolus meristosporus CBS 931.73]|eukprot:ORX88406.1 NAD(P)-binding protein [Basidiobolus meristosporus CBS 931.73]